VYGALHGVRGIINEDLVDLTRETSHNLELVAATPSSALGSTRDKPDVPYCAEIFKVLQAHQIEQFYYIGGNDSSDTVRIVSEQAQAAGYPLRCIHIPRPSTTIWSAMTTRRASLGRALCGAGLRRRQPDNASLPGVYVGVVMGRHAGFLTAASALGKNSRRWPAPDLPAGARVLARAVPADVKACYERYGRCVIAVSEGIHDASGDADRESAGQRHRARCAWQCAAVGHGCAGRSAVRRDQGQAGHQARARRYLRLSAALLHRLRVRCRPARGARSGEKAVQFAMWGQRNGSVAIKRTGFYSVDYELLPLDAVAGKTRTMEDEFISASGTDVTDAFRMYLRPLLGSGMPDAFRLRPAPVAKILKLRGQI
jgi:6-phosphofructokinase 1